MHWVNRFGEQLPFNLCRSGTARSFMVPNKLLIIPGYKSRIRCSGATGPKIITLVALSED